MKRDTTAAERNLSGALIAGAFSFVGLAIFASASFVDKTDPDSLMMGNSFVAAAVVMLITSIIFGGKSLKRVTPGRLNGFNLQASCGLLGVTMLMCASAIFAFNPREPKDAPDLSNLAMRLGAAEARIKALEADPRPPCRKTAPVRAATVGTAPSTSAQSGVNLLPGDRIKNTRF